MTPMFENILDIIFLLSGVIFSLFLFAKSHKRLSYIALGLMAFSISIGEGFHLVPVLLKEFNLPVMDLYEFFGVGQFVTSLVLTLLFLFFYWVYKLRYQNKNTTSLDIAIYALAVFKIVFTLVDDSFFQNNIFMSLMRNVPYIVMTALLLYVGYFWAKKKDDLYIKCLYIYLSISFAAYLIYKDTTNEVNHHFNVLPVMIIVAIISITVYFFWNSIQANKTIKKLE